MTKPKNTPARPKPPVKVRLCVRAVNKAGFHRCGRHFSHEEETVLTVMTRPVTRTQITPAQAQKLKAEPLLIVKEA